MIFCFRDLLEKKLTPRFRAVLSGLNSNITRLHPEVYAILTLARCNVCRQVLRDKRFPGNTLSR
jgi:hypothetical protein